MRRVMFALSLCGAMHGMAQAAGSVEAGKRVFVRCLNCHDVGANARNGFGPHLNGVLGRKAGSVPGYNYSAAMKAAPVVWNERNLAAFLRDTDSVVPGNKMRFFGFVTQNQLNDLMAYLRAHPAIAPKPPVAPKPTLRSP